MTDQSFAAVGGMLRLPAVKRATGVSKRTIYRWMEQGRFPRAVREGPNTVAWREADVRAWQESCAETGSSN